MKNKILLVSLLSLLAFNVNAEDNLALNKNFVELEIGQGFGKYKYYLDGNHWKELDSNSKPSIGVVYLRSFADDKFRLRAGLHYDTSKIDYTETYYEARGTSNYEYSSTIISTKNIIGLSVGGEYDLYKKEKYSLFASLVLNFNYVNSSFDSKLKIYKDIDGTIDGLGNLDLIYSNEDNFDESGVVVPVEIGFGGLYNINNNFSFVGKAVYVTPASFTVNYDNAKFKTEMGNYAKVSVAFRYGF